MRLLQLILLLLFGGLASILHAQKVDGKFTNYSLKQTLEFKNGDYSWLQEDTTVKGEFSIVNTDLFFYKNNGSNPERWRIIKSTDSTLSIKSINQTIHFQKSRKLEKPKKAIQLIPNQGISIQSIFRGVLGMLSLLALAFLFSSNKKSIKWKGVFIGLTAQILLAIGVLKVPMIQAVFEYVGGLFVLVLDFTRAGSTFLLGGMMDSESYGFIFLFQVLPTIIFFSALTSLLFYLGIIQKIVKTLAVVLTKLLAISGKACLLPAISFWDKQKLH